MFLSTRANNDCNCLFLGFPLASVFDGFKCHFMAGHTASQMLLNIPVSTEIFFSEWMAVLLSYSKRRKQELFYIGLMEREECSRQTVMVMGKMCSSPQWIKCKQPRSLGRTPTEKYESNYMMRVFILFTNLVENERKHHC